MGRFIGTLAVEVVNDDAEGLFRLLQPLKFLSSTGALVIAPAGYVTDFCSVPLMFRAIVGEQARKSGTIHDRLYGTHELGRTDADAMLKEMLLVEGVPAYQATAYWAMVRLFGWIFYRNLTNNAARNKYG